MSPKAHPTITEAVDDAVAETLDICAREAPPIFVSDGQDSYGQALLRKLCIIEAYPGTGTGGADHESPRYYPLQTSIMPMLSKSATATG
jgi:hypothetical protein